MNRKILTAQIMVSTTFALLALLAPQMLYVAECVVLARFVNVYPPPRISALDLFMVIAVASLLPAIGYVSHRAAGVAATTDRPDAALPGILYIALAGISFMPALLAPLVDSFGRWIAIGGALCWMLSALSVLCYVGSLCAAEAEREGKTPGLALLAAGYTLGGFGGAHLALRAAPDSKALAELTRQPPGGAILAAVALAIFLHVVMP